ncbi:hypothetical protein IE53DRAFT_309610 [Violaceomyces palustris]|uniref:Uncharacterized protein n=1 Tax=Violaceomyces palustris TaxID=1673888 RepID=A0ACD0P6T3_9BASI|nr:hypothetical protein IE53DRAFT_309610 [Violaceomyces palustris]
MASSNASEETFIERSPVGDSMSAATISAGAGLFVSAVQNSIQTHNKGALGVFTRTGSTIALFTAMGGIFSYTDSMVANIRQKNDAFNGAAGGCAAGLVAGAAARSIPMMAGSCIALASLVGTFDAAGKSLTGTYAKPSPADFIPSEGGHAEKSWRELREERRKNFFKVSIQPPGASVEVFADHVTRAVDLALVRDLLRCCRSLGWMDETLNLYFSSSRSFSIKKKNPRGTCDCSTLNSVHLSSCSDTEKARGCRDGMSGGFTVTDMRHRIGITERMGCQTGD